MIDYQHLALLIIAIFKTLFYFFKHCQNHQLDTFNISDDYWKTLFDWTRKVAERKIGPPPISKRKGAANKVISGDYILD